MSKAKPNDRAGRCSPEVAGKILDADFQNVVAKVAAGKPLTVAERSRIESRAAGSEESLAYAKTLVELAAMLGRHPPDAHHLAEDGRLTEAALQRHVAGRRLARVRAAARAQGGQGAGRQEEALKARKLLAEVEERELRLAVKRGEFIAVEEVRADMDESRRPGDVDCSARNSRTNCRRSSPVSTPPASRRSAARPSTRCSRCSTRDERMNARETRRSGARRGVRRIAARRGRGARITSSSIPVFAHPRPLPLGQLAADPRADGGAGRSARSGSCSSSRRSSRARPACGELGLCHIIANLPGPTLWLDQTDDDAKDQSESRGCRSSSTNARRCTRSLPAQPTQEAEHHDPLRQRHDALGARGAQQDQPPAPLDPLAHRR